MPSNAPITFQFAGLPAGYCFTTPERLALDIAAGLSGFLPGEFTTIINSDTKPTRSDRDKLWHKTIAGAPSGHIFMFFNGSWVARNLVEPSGDERRIFMGIESDIWAYDGGDGNNPTVTPPTDATGAMWEKDAAFDFRMALGAGTSPAPVSTIVAVGGTGGEEKHTLTQAELPDVIFPVKETNNPALTSQGLWGEGSTGDASTGDNGLTSPNSGENPTYISVHSGGSGTAHQNMPPFIGVYFIKRTQRVFYLA